MPDLPIYREDPSQGVPLYVPDAHGTTEKDPRQGSPLRAWMGIATEKGWPKRPSDCQLQEAGKKTLIGPWVLQRRHPVSLHTWCHQGPHTPSSCTTFTLNSHWGRVATGKKNSLASMHAGSLQSCPTLWTVACQASPSGGFSRQEYWSVLANTGCHTLLDHYISCCPSHQLPWVLPKSLLPKLLHHLHTWPSQGQTQVLQGSLRSKPQETTHMQRWK